MVADTPNWSTGSLDYPRDEETGDPRVNRAPRVLLIGAGDTYLSALEVYLQAQGLDVFETADPSSASEWIDANGPVDVAVIDADQSPIENAEVQDRIRGLAAEFPLAVISAVRGEANEETALRNGAADFLSKSRSPSIVAKRLWLLIDGAKSRTAERTPSDSSSTGPLAIHPRSHRALWKGAEVPLTITQFKIVRLLATRAGEDISYREIYDVVHGVGFQAGDGPNGYRSNVRSLIRKVRVRFRKIDPAFDEIENYPGHGYRWRVPSAAPPNASRAPERSGGRDRLGAHDPGRDGLETTPR